MRVVSTAPPRSEEIEALLGLLGRERTARLREAAAELRTTLGSGTLWHISSTDVGGGVAEILHFLIPLYQYLGIPVRWMVVEGEAPFFAATKRLGNQAYGSDESIDRLSSQDRDCYVRTLAANATQIRTVLGRDDVLMLHDHQTAGLVDLLSGSGARMYWRCHVGTDQPTVGSQQAWAYMSPFLKPASGVVFSVERHVPELLGEHRLGLIPPVIWPFSPKNRHLSEPAIRERLARCHLGRSPHPKGDDRVPVLTDGAPDPEAPLVVQVSRWDRLKDMHGVLEGFGSQVPDGHLALLGPDPAAIPDDVEQVHWFQACRDTWRGLPRAQRRRASVVCLPMSDMEDNALLVNAVQRAATVVVQKSLAEGFGLTVTEAMWKEKPVIGAAVGGIAEQIRHGHNGLLLDDPNNLDECGRLIRSAVSGHFDLGGLGRRARCDVHRNWLPDRDVVGTADLLGGRSQDAIARPDQRRGGET